MFYDNLGNLIADIQNRQVLSVRPVEDMKTVALYVAHIGTFRSGDDRGRKIGLQP